jgi:hypothetical protein
MSVRLTTISVGALYLALQLAALYLLANTVLTGFALVP